MKPSEVKPERRKRWLTSAITAACCTVAGGSCLSPQQVYVADTQARSWWQPTEIVIPNTDTVTPRDFTLIVRSNTSLACDTLTLRVALEAPDSLRYEELLTLRVQAAPHQAAAIRTLTEWPYRTQSILRDTGRYRLILTPTHPLQGIEAVGIEISASR